MFDDVSNNTAPGTFSGSGWLTKTETAFHWIRQAIEDGELAPGTKLTVKDLAAAARMSPTPVREALRMLQMQGMVRHEPHHGMVVATFAAPQMREVYALRVLIEPEAARLAAINAQDADIERIQEIHFELIAAEREGYAEVAALNRAFHGAIYELAGSELMMEFINRLWSTIPIEAMWTSRRAAKSIAEHSDVLDALKARDPDATFNAVLTHLRGGSRTEWPDQMLGADGHDPDDSPVSPAY